MVIKANACSVVVFVIFLCSPLILLCSYSCLCIFTVGYNLLNVLDPRAGGAMVEAIQAEVKPTWLDQIRYRFLHPTSERFATYGNTILGADDEDDVDGTSDPLERKLSSFRVRVLIDLLKA
ncbi:hypothetical protein Hdeb2414_s0018g00514921 [Helianthus debilis subsp. tardiflorus]